MALWPAHGSRYPRILLKTERCHDRPIPSFKRWLRPVSLRRSEEPAGPCGLRGSNQDIPRAGKGGSPEVFTVADSGNQEEGGVRQPGNEPHLHLAYGAYERFDP